MSEELKPTTSTVQKPSQAGGKKPRGRMNIVKGRVISHKADKTISVLIYYLMKHPKYKRPIRRKSVFKAHDESNQAREGDVVSIYETRPLSKTKRWKLLKIVEKSTGQKTAAGAASAQQTSAASSSPSSEVKGESLK